MVSALFGLMVGLFARLWLSTLRLSVVVHPSLQAVGNRPWVLALWHGQMMPLLSYRLRRRTVALVSLSRDGELLCWAFSVLGLSNERGSGSRRGAEGRRAMVRRLRGGWDAAFAADGPRGPRREARPGAIASARDAGGVVVPFTAACARSVVLQRSWDQFEIPLPFSRVAVVLGPPLEPHAVGTGELSAAIEAGRALACEVIGVASTNLPVCTREIPA